METKQHLYFSAKAKSIFCAWLSNREKWDRISFYYKSNGKYLGSIYAANTTTYNISEKLKDLPSAEKLKVQFETVQKSNLSGDYLKKT